MNPPQIIPETLQARTFVLRHNPNCPKPFEVRLCGAYPILDIKPHNESNDAIGWGETLEEAATRAIAAAEWFKSNGITSTANSPQWTQRAEAQKASEVDRLLLEILFQIGQAVGVNGQKAGETRYEFGTRILEAAKKLGTRSVQALDAFRHVNAALAQLENAKKELAP